MLLLLRSDKEKGNTIVDFTFPIIIFSARAHQHTYYIIICETFCFYMFIMQGHSL